MTNTNTMIYKNTKYIQLEMKRENTNTKKNTNTNTNKKTKYIQLEMKRENTKTKKEEKHKYKYKQKHKICPVGDEARKEKQSYHVKAGSAQRRGEDNI